MAQELHHHIEALERMMDEDILGADGSEAVAAMIADAFRKPRDIGLELKIGPLVEDQLAQIR
ncbi:MAG: hypothetical protein WDM89_15355 [Rhizomicrobium sp.]